MRRRKRWAAFAVLSGLFASGAASAEGPAIAPCQAEKVDVGGGGLWVELAGEGAVTVLFETGNGADSSVWSALATDVRATGVRTMLYDRAGTGKSDPDPRPYRIEHEVDSLRRALAHCEVTGPIVVVSHSYGGFLSQLLAAEAPPLQKFRVAGLVLVDANIPAFFSETEVAAILAQYRPQYDAVRQQAPALAATIIPILEAYPATVETMRRTSLPKGLPIVDIYAGNSWAATPESAAAMRRAHIEFAAADGNRESVFAEASSHQLMRDRPDLIVAAIANVIRRVSR